MEQNRKGMPGWIKGCLTGCAVFMVLVLILMTVVCQRLKGMFQGMVDAESSYEQVVEQLGDYDRFHPDPSVSVTADQLERFLRIREGLAEDQAALDQVFRDFNLDDDLETESKFRKVLGVLSELGGLLNPAGEYVAARNEMLLAENMSIGEYSWIYGLVYYSWLGQDLTAGPKLTLEGETRELFRDAEGTLSPREQHRRYRRVADALFRNQIEGVPDQAGERKAFLMQELARFENTPRSILWQDGLPKAEAALLERYRSRLEPTWHPGTNLLELPFPEDQGGFRIETN